MDVEATIRFILDAQARFFAGMEEFRAGMEKMRERQDKFDQQLAALAAQQASHSEQQNAINLALGKAMLGITEHIDRLTAKQEATDEKLNALIAVVDGFVRRQPPT